MNDFNNQIAWVTGGGSGIGQDACIGLAKKGVKVMISGRSMNKLEQTKSFIEAEGGYAECYVCDITSFENVEKTTNEIISKHGKIDIFVGAAGQLSDSSYTHMTDNKVWHKMIDVILNGTFYCIKNILPSMINNKYGRIILIGSAACIKGMACNIGYATAKGGLTQMTKTIAKEYGKIGITCNIIYPGIIETPMADGMKMVYGRDTIKNDMIVGDIGQTRNVTHGILYFADPLAEHVTGTELDITGGMFLSSNVENFLLSALNGQIMQ